MERFLGTWELDPSACTYERGLPPRQGTYRIEPEGDTLLFTADWVAADGTPGTVAYRSTPDGQPHPLENPAVADALVTRVTDLPSLDTDTLKDGKVIAFARRLLSPDQTEMTVSQSFTLPDGSTVTNVALYRKAHSAATRP